MFLVEQANSGKQFAMKVLDKVKIFQEQIIDYTCAERNILTQIKHPFIVELFYAFQTAKKLFLVLEYCPCGDIGDVLKKERRF